MSNDHINANPDIAAQLSEIEAALNSGVNNTDNNNNNNNSNSNEDEIFKFLNMTPGTASASTEVGPDYFANQFPDVTQQQHQQQEQSYSQNSQSIPLPQQIPQEHQSQYQDINKQPQLQHSASSFQQPSFQSPSDIGMISQYVRTPPVRNSTNGSNKFNNIYFEESVPSPVSNLNSPVDFSNISFPPQQQQQQQHQQIHHQSSPQHHHHQSQHQHQSQLQQHQHLQQTPQLQLNPQIQPQLQSQPLAHHSQGQQYQQQQQYQQLPQFPYLNNNNSTTNVNTSNLSMTNYSDSSTPVIQLDRVFPDYPDSQTRNDPTSFLSLSQATPPQVQIHQSDHSEEFTNNVVDYQIHQTMFAPTSGNNDFLLNPYSGDQFKNAREVSSNNSQSDLSAANSPYFSAVESIYDDEEDTSRIGDNLEDPDSLLASQTIEQLHLNVPNTVVSKAQQRSYKNLVLIHNSLEELTEQNLQQQQQQQFQPNQPQRTSHKAVPTTPSINVTNHAENVPSAAATAAATPSLFSASSSPSGGRSRSTSFKNNDRPQIKIEDTSYSCNSENGTASSTPVFVYNSPDNQTSSGGLNGMGLSNSGRDQLNVDDGHSFLSPPDDSAHSKMRLGRQRRHSDASSTYSRSSSRSQSRSRSHSRAPSEDSAYDSDASLSREKLSELAAPPSPNKKAQKNPALYACKICDKKFTRPYNLKSHLRTHTNERPFLCTVCGKAFARQHDRKRHEDLHTGEKKFQCKGSLADGVTMWGCGKRFARTDALRRHFQTESGKECIRPLMEEIDKERGINLENGQHSFLQQYGSVQPQFSVENAGTGLRTEIDTSDINDFTSLLDQILNSQSLAVAASAGNQSSNSNDE